MMSTPASQPLLLRVGELKKYFPVKRGPTTRRSSEQVHAVDGVSFDVFAGEAVGVVGESGCGKTTLGRCIIRLEDATDGTIWFNGHDITHLSRRRLRPLRREMQMVFQLSLIHISEPTRPY